MKNVVPEQPMFTDITLLGNHNEVLVGKKKPLEAQSF